MRAFQKGAGVLKQKQHCLLPALCLCPNSPAPTLDVTACSKAWENSVGCGAVLPSEQQSPTLPIWLSYLTFSFCFLFPGWKGTSSCQREASLLPPHSCAELWAGHQSSIKICFCTGCQLSQVPGPCRSLRAEQHTCCGLIFFGFFSAAEAQMLAFFFFFAAWQREHGGLGLAPNPSAITLHTTCIFLWLCLGYLR